MCLDNLGSGEYEILVNEDTLNLPDDYELGRFN